MRYAHKKSVELLVFIGTFEVFDYLYTPITTYKSTQIRESRRLGLECNLKVSKFQKYQISAIRFFLFYDVHTNLCAMLHGHYFSFIILFQNRLQKYD